MELPARGVRGELPDGVDGKSKAKRQKSEGNGHHRPFPLSWPSSRFSAVRKADRGTIVPRSAQRGICELRVRIIAPRGGRSCRHVVRLSASVCYPRRAGGVCGRGDTDAGYQRRRVGDRLPMLRNRGGNRCFGAEVAKQRNLLDMKLVIEHHDPDAVRLLEEGFRSHPQVEARLQRRWEPRVSPGVDAYCISITAAERWGAHRRALIHQAQVFRTGAEDRAKGWPSFVIAGLIARPDEDVYDPSLAPLIIRAAIVAARRFNAHGEESIGIRGQTTH